MEKIILNKNFLFKYLISLFLILFFTNTLFAGNNFVKSEIEDGKLKLYFSSNIERVTYFTLPDVNAEGVTKYIYDVYGGVLPPNRGISQHTFRTVESFRMGQNSPTKLRVIVRSKEKLPETHVFSDNIFTIPLVYTKGEDNDTISRSPLGKKYIVVIDAGHGGKDNGASSGKEKKEKNITLSVSEKLKVLLEERGFKVYMTRTDDTFVPLPNRTEFANKKQADIFISVHANAAPKETLNKVFNGIEVYYLSPAKTERAKSAAAKENAVMFEGKDKYSTNEYLSLLSREKIIESHKLGLDVSTMMLSNVRNSFGEVSDGGVKPANFWVLVGAQMPAVLVETGYITNPKEGENLMDVYYKSLLAKGIAEGIERYLKNK